MKNIFSSVLPRPRSRSAEARYCSPQDFLTEGKKLRIGDREDEKMRNNSHGGFFSDWKKQLRIWR